MIYSEKEFSNMMNEYEKVKVKCKHCGRKKVIPVWRDKELCDWCGYYIYRNKQMEFKDNIKKMIKERNYE